MIELMDDNLCWCLLDVGELVYVDVVLWVNRSLVLFDLFRYLICWEDFSELVLYV